MTDSASTIIYSINSTTCLGKKTTKKPKITSSHLKASNSYEHKFQWLRTTVVFILIDSVWFSGYHTSKTINETRALKCKPSAKNNEHLLHWKMSTHKIEASCGLAVYNSVHVHNL